MLNSHIIFFLKVLETFISSTYQYFFLFLFLQCSLLEQYVLNQEIICNLMCVKALLLFHGIFGLKHIIGDYSFNAEIRFYLLYLLNLIFLRYMLYFLSHLLKAYFLFIICLFI